MRTIVVDPNEWVLNTRTGEMKQSKNLTDQERGTEEWSRITREERRKLARKLKRKTH